MTSLLLEKLAGAEKPEKAGNALQCPAQPTVSALGRGYRWVLGSEGSRLQRQG